MRLYVAVAATDRQYEAAALSHLERALALAPNRELSAAPLAPPGRLPPRRQADGRLELRWRPSPGAGYHQISESITPGFWPTIRYVYVPAQSVLVTPSASSRYRFRACRYPGYCSDWVEWESPRPGGSEPAGAHRR